MRTTKRSFLNLGYLDFDDKGDSLKEYLPTSVTSSLFKHIEKVKEKLKACRLISKAKLIEEFGST